MPAVKHAPGRFCWFECGSTDAARARTFYRELFGWDTTETMMPGGGAYTLFESQGEEVAGLYALVGPEWEGVPSNWGAYVAVEDVDESARRAAALGATMMLEPTQIAGVGRIAYFRDPTGAAVGIARFEGRHGTSTKGPFG
jgi:predicted enzyme related to lactoylglutathione lyase